MTWGKVVNLDFQPTGRFYEVTYEKCASFGQVGEEVLYLNWGGVVLQFADGRRSTCALGDLTEVGRPDGWPESEE